MRGVLLVDWFVLSELLATGLIRSLLNFSMPSTQLLHTRYS